MPEVQFTLSLAIFAAMLMATFAAAWAGRLHTKRVKSTALVDQKLNKWLVGLSAGATANSGFVVTGAVGLGYSYGAQWLMLPLAWLLGDIIFWALFPHRINRIGTIAKATTITDVITHGLDKKSKLLIQLVAGLVIVCCLGGYVAAQWLAGEKFLDGAFGVSGYAALLIFAALIIGYTALGEFRGSVYADSLQALIRVFGTVIALIAIVSVATESQDQFNQNWVKAGPNFLNPFPQETIWGALGFIAGFAGASLGFGLGQPQMVTRYMAGASPRETRAAWWIYISFVQFTWLSMTFFGMMLRGIMPGLDDPEMGLSVFFASSMGALLTGIIAADIFATIAATSNSLLVVMAQTVCYDIFSQRRTNNFDAPSLWPYTAAIGLATMLASALLQSSVFEIAITSASLLGAGLAPVMAVRAFGQRPSAKAILASIVLGFVTALAWKLVGWGSSLNEAVPGMIAGLAVLVALRWINAPPAPLEEA